MESPKLNNIRKELNHLPKEVLAEYCLKIAKYKTENKEFLNYLLFYSDNNELYIAEIKKMLDEGFSDLPYSDYTATKVLRKLTRLMNKHIKFMGNKALELELALYFCHLFIEKSSPKTHHKPLIGLLFRQLKRIEKLIPKLDEDLQFDFQN
jgi:hypothetical protein